MAEKNPKQTEAKDEAAVEIEDEALDGAVGGAARQKPRSSDPETGGERG